MLGGNYISTFLTSHHPYDYAREHIIYPRREYYREYTDDDIKALKHHTPFSKKPLKLRPCRPSLLEYHLRESSRLLVNGEPLWRVELKPDYSLQEEIEYIYGPRWILVSYEEDSFVNFIQVDIDRHHPDDDASAQKTVQILLEASRHFGFEIVWTTSPGYLDESGSFVHGLYAWIRLDKNHMVMDLRPHVLGFLHSIGLPELANAHEGAYLKKKKLVRLPAQFNTEIADPRAFSKIHSHTPIEAVLVFQDAWSRAVPLKSEALRSFTPPSPHREQRGVCTHSSATLPPLPPYGDTFDALLKWGRPIVNKLYPDTQKVPQCVEELIATAQERLPSVSRTRQDVVVLRKKAEGIVKFLWDNTDAKRIGCQTNDDEDAERFAPHASYIEENRDALIAMVPVRLRDAARAIMDLMMKYDGRVAAKAIHHGTPTPICTYRNWKLIRETWGIVTLVEYQKNAGDKGTCKQWGFLAVIEEETVTGSEQHLETELDCLDTDLQ